MTHIDSPGVLVRPIPSLRRTSHTLTMTCPGFDDSLDVVITAQGNGDDIDILSVDDVSVGMTSLLPDEIYVRKSAVFCDGTASDFISLRDWCEMTAGEGSYLERVLGERRGV